MASEARTEDEAGESEFASWLASQGYMMITETGDGRWAALHPFLFTWAIIQGRTNDLLGYDDRWCYSSFDNAVDGLNSWILSGFEGEPSGWHRHPDTGRRRPEGDSDLEYINL